MERRNRVRRRGKRPVQGVVLAAMLLGVMLGVGACGAEPVVEAAPASEAPDWGVAAGVESAVRSADGLTVTGRAPPGVRIALTTSGADRQAAWAATTGADGEFEVHLPSLSVPMLYRVEAQSGPGGVWTIDKLVVTPGPDGVSAVLRPGAAARSLEGRALLGAVDHDGAVALVSGAAAPGETIRIIVDERPAIVVQAGADGRYVARASGIPSGPRRIRVAAGEQTAEALLMLVRPEAGDLMAAGQAGGVRVGWTLPGGGGQSTWIAGR